jgi:diaminopimelate decarboxylase
MDAQRLGARLPSRDLLAQDAPLAGARPGDRVVVPATGAYTYSLQSNYNAGRRSCS